MLFALLLLPAMIKPGRVSSDSRPLVVVLAEELARALRAYTAEFQEFPSGNYSQVLAALRGKNPQGITFLDASEEHVSEAGEFVDPWGRPFMITARGTKYVRIRSAGRDGIFRKGSEKSDDYDSAGDLILGMFGASSERHAGEQESP